MKHAAHISQNLSLVGNALLETAWPTRCVLCDKPGTLLCDRCAKQQRFIDQNLACPRCGAAAGHLICTECNSFTAPQGLPFQDCASVFEFNDDVKIIITTFKDRGEQRLCHVIAGYLHPLANPRWSPSLDAIAYIPDTLAAFRRRGFDHGRLMALALGQRMGLPTLGLLARPVNTDQRLLGRRDRAQNMAGAFSLNPKATGKVPANILLIDDVLTTGATLSAASSLLRRKGARCIHCLTFARV